MSPTQSTSGAGFLKKGEGIPDWGAWLSREVSQFLAGVAVPPESS